ncbi:MAG: ATP-binding cassette domain-containing protein [Akkermansiaceae bacterium]|nr:ATP-binding cassette domain-containing protein [Verrucomicrobiales bacterium]
MSEPSGTDRPLLEMRGVSVSAMRDQNTVIMENVDWTVAAGDFWVIGGLQGAGKSDFLLLAGGLMAPVAGTYSFREEKMPIFEDHRLRERLKLGFVFDGGQLLNHLTIAENIALPLRYHKNLGIEQARAEVQRMLDLTDLAPWADSTPGAVGRNWQQRVGLARALMLRPEVLLLDNPLGGLDLRHRGWWLNFLSELSSGHEWLDKKPVTLVVTADDLPPWRKRARQFAVLKEKRFVIIGSWDDVEKATDERVQDLLAFAAQAS